MHKITEIPKIHMRFFLLKSYVKFPAIPPKTNIIPANATNGNIEKLL